MSEDDKELAASIVPAPECAEHVLQFIALRYMRPRSKLILYDAFVITFTNLGTVVPGL
jgi:hypothetical protein